MHTPASGGGSDLDPALLIAYQANTPSALRAFPEQAYTPLLRMARYLGGRLPRDLHDDVVQEALVSLLTTNAPYDPDRAAASTYARLHVRQAVRTVSAAITPAGQKTRPDSADEIVRPAPICDAITVADSTHTPEHTERRIDVDAVLRRVRVFGASDPKRAPFASAVALVYNADATWTDAARAVGVSRDTLRRLRIRFAAHSGFGSAFSRASNTRS